MQKETSENEKLKCDHTNKNVEEIIQFNWGENRVVLYVWFGVGIESTSMVFSFHIIYWLYTITKMNI